MAPKESIERIEALGTGLTVTGAWFRSEYGNSEPIYYHPSTMIGGREIPYVGIYDDDSRYIREACNTNFMVDTDIPRLGLGFSLTFQCQWYTRELNTHRSSRPTSPVGAAARRAAAERRGSSPAAAMRHSRVSAATARRRARSETGSTPRPAKLAV